MATTRFYLGGVNAAINLGGPLSGGGLWEGSITSANTTKKALTTTGSTANNANATAVGTGVNPNDIMFWQGISEPLAAQTINATRSTCSRGVLSLMLRICASCGLGCTAVIFSCALTMRTP